MRQNRAMDLPLPPHRQVALSAPFQKRRCILLNLVWIFKSNPLTKASRFATIFVLTARILGGRQAQMVRVRKVSAAGPGRDIGEGAIGECILREEVGRRRADTRQGLGL